MMYRRSDSDLTPELSQFLRQVRNNWNQPHRVVQWLDDRNHNYLLNELQFHLQEQLDRQTMTPTTVNIVWFTRQTYKELFDQLYYPSELGEQASAGLQNFRDEVLALDKVQRWIAGNIAWFLGGTNEIVARRLGVDIKTVQRILDSTAVFVDELWQSRYIPNARRRDSGSYGGQVQIVDDADEVLSVATAQLWWRHTGSGIMEWGGILRNLSDSGSWLMPAFASQHLTIRMDDGREGRFIVSELRTSPNTVATIVGTGPAPFRERAQSESIEWTADARDAYRRLIARTPRGDILTVLLYDEIDIPGPRHQVVPGMWMSDVVAPEHRIRARVYNGDEMQFSVLSPIHIRAYASSAESAVLNEVSRIATSGEWKAEETYILD